MPVSIACYFLLLLLACVLTHCSTSSAYSASAACSQSFPRPWNATGTSSEARRTHAGRKRRAGARATVRPRRPSCPAARSCPVRLARRGLPTTSSFPTPSEHSSDEPGGSLQGEWRDMTPTCRAQPPPLPSHSPRPPFTSPTVSAPSNVNSNEPGGSSQHTGRRWRAEARETARPCRLSCSAARSCPPPLARRAVQARGPPRALKPQQR